MEGDRDKRVDTACTLVGEPTGVTGILHVGGKGMRNQILPEMVKTRVVTSLVHCAFMCTDVNRF